MNYAELDMKLQGRNRERRKLANNTYLCRDSEKINLLYHATNVAVFHSNGDIVLDSGGWHTMTTKERINTALNSTNRIIITDKGVWYVARKDNGYCWDKQNWLCRFQDGIVIHADGKITGGLTETPNRQKADKILKAKVKKYAQRCADSVPLDKPNGGDCWLCSMVDDKGESWGDSSKDTSHIDSHIKENYVVPSLVFQALKAHYNAPMAFWEAFKDIGWTSDNRDFGKLAVKKSVYKFIMKRKGYVV